MNVPGESRLGNMKSASRKFFPQFVLAGYSRLDEKLTDCSVTLLFHLSVFYLFSIG